MKHPKKLLKRSTSISNIVTKIKFLLPTLILTSKFEKKMFIPRSFNKTVFLTSQCCNWGFKIGITIQIVILSSINQEIA